MDLTNKIKMTKNSNDQGFLLSSKRINNDHLLQHHTECTKDNKQRLKKIKNLEELINFKVSSVADLLADKESAFLGDHITSTTA
jgi:hypothetical protein